MNAPILRLFVVFLLLFGALVAFTSYNSVINAEEYRDNELNARTTIKAQQIRRGLIRARDGKLLARSVKGEADLYTRRYTPDARPFAQAIGYSFVDRQQAGIERERNDELNGERNELTSVIDELRGKQQEGDNVVLNLDPKGQQAAVEALGGRRGAVVAMEPDTGKVRVMLSVPTYSPNAVADDRAFKQLSTDEENSPLINRATQNGYPPGSTMKVVTAVAAIDSGRFGPNSTFDGSSPQTFDTQPLSNFGGAQFPGVSFTDALTKSVNTVFAQIGERLGGRTMGRYMDRFGFNADPPMDYPDDQMTASGVFGSDGQRIDVKKGSTDIARVAIGQERLRVTPLQMAMVASAVGNDGMLMKPRLTDRIVDRDGREVESIEPEEMGRVMKSSTARTVTAMMRRVVEEGTGTAAALEGVAIAGKTGTAEIDIARDINQPWFIGFAPAQDAKIAIAVTIERTQGGTGGVDAAPIAKRVLEELTG